jgi:DNA-directed RNA polymerase subunit RPC12/RpoP
MPYELSQNKKTYTCPMHPEVQSEQPGTCPKCGMKLVEKVQQDKGKSRWMRTK